MSVQSANALKEKAISKALAKRSKVALCMHGINTKYCLRCCEINAKKSEKRKKKI